jgi:hypothetical protein
METGKLCTYNQTRGCFLGLDIEGADFSAAILDERMQTLTPKSGIGIWMIPFKGISETCVRFPIDLVYLDRHCAVLDVVESFPIFRVSASCPAAASVLALPSRTIAATRTLPGDLLIFCAPAEMKRRLRQFPAAKTVADAVQGGNSWEPEPTHGDAGDLPQREDVSSHGKSLAEAETKNVKPAKSWLARWLSPDPPDPRKAARESLSGLAACFWTGGVPEQHSVRDISSTGLYVFTEERWYPGTAVRMTLTDLMEPTRERSISVEVRVVRWGNDGVGVEFILQKRPRSGHAPLLEDVDEKQLDEFLQRFRSGNY